MPRCCVIEMLMVDKVKKVDVAEVPVCISGKPHPPHQPNLPLRLNRLFITMICLSQSSNSGDQIA
ncbi:MAG: hypothetical protein ACI9CQ_001154 [Saprospiraceae bacterium]|jgi:hypothetical protein